MKSALKSRCPILHSTIWRDKGRRIVELKAKGGPEKPLLVALVPSSSSSLLSSSSSSSSEEEEEGDRVARSAK